MLFGSLLNFCLRECSGQVMMKCRCISISLGCPNQICPADSVVCILIHLLVNLNCYYPLNTFMEARHMHSFQRRGCSKIIAKNTKNGLMASCLIRTSWNHHLLESPWSAPHKNTTAVQVSPSVCLLLHQNIGNFLWISQKIHNKKDNKTSHEWKSIFELNFRLK